MTNVAEFLSDAWIDALNDRLETLTVLPDIGDEIVIEMVVRGNSGSNTWTLTLGTSGASIVAGAVKHPTLTIFTDPETALELSNNTTNAQRAIDSGRLRIRGDLNRLAVVVRLMNTLNAKA